MMNILRNILSSLVLISAVATGFGQGTVVYTNNPTLTKAMKDQGTYSSGTTYALHDVVIYSGGSYLSLVGSNTGNTPSSSPSQWQTLGTGVDSTARTAASNAQSTANSAAQKSANLTDLVSAAAARTALGLGTSATTDSSSYATPSSVTAAVTAAKTMLGGTSSTLAGSSLAAGAEEHVDVAITGGVVGSYGGAGASDASLEPVGIRIYAKVTTTTNLRIYRRNETAAAITTTSKTYTFGVIQ